MGKMHRRDYAAMYGPTTGDAVRLGDTSLLAEIEHDHAATTAPPARSTCC